MWPNVVALFAFAWSLGPRWIAAETVPELARDVAVVTSEADPLPLDEDLETARLKTGMLLEEWAIDEAAGLEDVVGDGGRSCGTMQTQPWLVGIPCDRLRASRRVSLRAGLELMRASIARCGSVRGGLGAYAGGYCGARPKLVAARCNRSEAC